MDTMNEQRDKDVRKIKAVKISLMRNSKFVFWSGIMMVGRTEIRDDVPTALTNGRDEIYGREFVRALKPKELAFVVLHENMHKAFRHLSTWRKLYEENALLANQACDYVINYQLVQMDPEEQYIAFPRKDDKRWGLYDEQYAGMNAKQVFDLLKKEQKQQGGKGKGKGQAGKGKPGDEGSENFDEHDWDGAQEMSDKDAKELEREIDSALRQGQILAKQQGVGAGNAELALGELLEPKVDWREVLREFVQSACRGMDTSSWRKPNRRYLALDVYMPSMIGEQVGELVIGVDTSGSIGSRELNAFLSEVKSIADNTRPEKIHLLYWDTHVAGHEVYDGTNMDTLVQSTQAKGGGGTDVNCVFDFVKANLPQAPQACIILTDGYTPYPSSAPEYPVLWAVTTDQVPPFGKYIRVED